MENQLLEFSNESSLDGVNINVRWMKEWAIPPVHNRIFIFPYTAFWIVLSGTAVIELNRISYRIGRGSIVCIAHGSAQAWKSVGADEPFHYLSMACEAKIGAADLIRSYSFPPVASLSGREELGLIVDEWRSLAKEYEMFLQSFNQDHIKSLEREKNSRIPLGPFPSLVLNTDQTIQHLRIRAKGTLWVQLIFQALRSKLPDVPAAYDNRVFKICSLVESRLKEPPTLEEMARHVSLSKERLRTLFQASFGMSPLRYVRHVRLQRARDLLTLSSHSMKEIAAMIGYEDQHHFSRAFQKAEGISPLAYRRQQLAAK
jgi:AraC-like DNA-binding protein/mannose-6-phosphate isomerase-like protein (cupin superfamily)